MRKWRKLNCSLVHRARRLRVSNYLERRSRQVTSVAMGLEENEPLPCKILAKNSPANEKPRGVNICSSSSTLFFIDNKLEEIPRDSSTW